MIFTGLNVTAYRVHDPKWAFAPTSGSGAAVYGGRANRPGVNALYLSLDLETALAEYKQLDALLPPALVVSYHVRASQIVDFRHGFSEKWNPLWQDFYCNWRKLYFNDNSELPTWVIGDEVLGSGGKGILFRSAITGGDNLVLYNDVLSDSDSITVHDPNHALPKNQDSWSYSAL